MLKGAGDITKEVEEEYIDTHKEKKKRASITGKMKVLFSFSGVAYQKKLHFYFFSLSVYLYIFFFSEAVDGWSGEVIRWVTPIRKRKKKRRKRRVAPDCWLLATAPARHVHVCT